MQITGQSAQIIFIHPAYAKYRRPLFEKFLNHYNITFYFIRPPVAYLQDRFYQEFPGKAFFPKNVKTSNKYAYILREYFVKPLMLFCTLMKNKYQVIITSIAVSPQTIVSFIISKIRKSKHILWLEEWTLPQWNPLISFLSRAISTVIIRNLDAIVVEGTAQYKYAMKFNVSREKVFFANHCSLDYSKYPTKNLKDELNIENSLVILYVGRIIKRKGLDILIKAYSKIVEKKKNVALIVCGDGDFLPYCKQLVHKLKLNKVFFLNYVGEEDIASVYKTADVFVLPSYVSHDTRVEVEGWGLVINEAMSMGLPIVTTDAVGAAQDLVKDNINGYVVKNGDVEELYWALTKILEDEKLRKIMGKNSRMIFESFNDFNKMFEGFKQAIDYVTKVHKVVTSENNKVKNAIRGLPCNIFGG